MESEKLEPPKDELPAKSSNGVLFLLNHLVDCKEWNCRLCIFIFGLIMTMFVFLFVKFKSNSASMMGFFGLISGAGASILGKLKSARD